MKILKGEAGELMVVFPYNPILVEKIKTIEGRRWYPEMRGIDGVLCAASVFTRRVDAKASYSETERHQLLGHKSSKTTEIYTHVSEKDIGWIKSPLDTIGKGDDDVAEK